MSNGQSRESIWPLITVIVGVIALAAVGWDVMLNRQNQSLAREMKELKGRVDAMDKKSTDAEAAAERQRRRARAAAAAEGPAAPGTQGTKKNEK